MPAAEAHPSISEVEIAPLFPHTDRLVLATAGGARWRLSELVRAQRAAIDDLVDRAGGILFRGFGVDEPEFTQTARALCKPLPYMYRSTPRTAVGDGIYTATEYPANQSIPMHCENAYQRDWPMRLMFLCDRPATRDGETPLADGARATDALDPTSCSASGTEA